jgi:hypothetical protein
MGVPALLEIKSGEFDLRGYEVVRTQFFGSASITSASFSSHGIRFSSACIRKFNVHEHIEMLVHPDSNLIAVRPCPKDFKYALRWASTNRDGLRTRLVSGAAYLGTIFELFNWKTDKRYRLRGEVFRTDSGIMALFDVRMPEIFTSRYEMIMPWATGFGEKYYSYKTSRLPEASIADAFLEYNNEPDLQPTAPGNASDNVRLLIEEMQNDGGDSSA